MLLVLVYRIIEIRGWRPAKTGGWLWPGMLGTKQIVVSGVITMSACVTLIVIILLMVSLQGEIITVNLLIIASAA